MTTTPAPLRAATEERDLFEAWYVEDARRQGVDMDSIEHLREGNGYGEYRHMLNGKWEGWQAARSATAPVAHRPAESELLEALQALLASDLSIIPPFNAGREAQDAWADMRAKARNDAAAVIAKYQGSRNEQR